MGLWKAEPVFSYNQLRTGSEPALELLRSKKGVRLITTQKDTATHPPTDHSIRAYQLFALGLLLQLILYKVKDGVTMTPCHPEEVNKLTVET